MTELEVKSKSFVLPTTHDGIKYRSRLEARWAIFMGLIGVKFQYEPEGYKLSDVCYLPDFYLPVQDIFYEIKPRWPNELEFKKATLLAAFTGKLVLIQCGQPQISTDYAPSDEEYNSEGALCVPPGGGEDYHYLWCECPKCGRCELQFDGRADRIKCRCFGSDHGDKGYNTHTNRLIQAFLIASTHQFK